MNYSLKFFSRTTQLNQSERLFISKYENRPLINRNYKLEALGVLTYLQMLLFSDPDSGFYYDVSGNRFQLLASEMGIQNKTLKQYLDWCFEYNLLDEEMFKKYSILTSFKMQDDYANAGLERRCQNINLDYVYPACSFTYKYEIALQKYKNAIQKKEFAKQNSGDETKQDKILKYDIREDNNLDIKTFNLSLQKFKNDFPNKKCDDDITYTPGIDFELLTKCINESPQFLLKINKPINWKWCIDHYEGIISGKYRQFPEVNKAKRCAQNFIGRDYSHTDLNDLVACKIESNQSLESFRATIKDVFPDITDEEILNMYKKGEW